MKKQLTSLSISTFFAVLLSASFYSSAYAALFTPIDPVTPPNAIICGDGELELGEQCDDGNTFNTDACIRKDTNNDGKLECYNATCGDGFTRAGIEQCDDGNTVNGDGCSSTCTTESNFNLEFEFEPINLETVLFDTTQGPDVNPPGGDITPTFSGLIVDGIATVLDMIISGNLEIGENLTVRGSSRFASMLLSGNLAMHGTAQIYTDNVHTTDVTASGDITSSYGTIGSFYTKWASSPVTTATHNAASVECYTGDQMTGCSGYFSHDSTSDKFFGAYIGGLLGPDDPGEKCIAAGGHGGGASDMIYAVARCFDPAGVRSGKYSY